MSLLVQDTTKKKRINKDLANLDLDLELDVGNDKEYKVKSIKNSVVYAKKV